MRVKDDLPFPVQVVTPKSALAAHYWRCVETRPRDRRVHYSIVLPRGVRPADVETATPSRHPQIAGIALYRSESHRGMEVRVGACPLSREVAPADWLETMLVTGGQMIVEARRRPTRGGDVLDALTRPPGIDGSTFSRWLAIKSCDERGGHILLLEALCAADDYVRLADSLMICISGFQPLFPGDWPYAERMEIFSGDDRASLSFVYPSSWRMHEEIIDADDMALVQIENIVGTAVLGKMTIMSAASSGPEALMYEYVSALRRGGGDSSMPTREPIASFGGLQHTWMAGCDVITGGAPRKLSLEMKGGTYGGLHYVLALLGVSKRDAPGIAAINNRAFEILTSQMQACD